MKSVFEVIHKVWNTAIITSAEGSFTLGKLVTILLSLIFLFVITAIIKKILVKRIFPKY